MAKSKRSRTIDRWVRRNQNKHLCGCGCGEYIVVKREHAKPSVPIPKFLKGHNLKLSPEEVKEVQEKKESVWEKLSDEEKERRLSQLKSFSRGEDNPSWKGGRRVDDNGYVQLLMPDHPFARGGYIAEHRYLVEERTKKYFPSSDLLIEIDGEKYLSPEAVVHHIDEVKTNNDPGKDGKDGNLMLLPHQQAHAFIHKSPLPLEERVRRINMGVYHSDPIDEEGEDDS